MNRFEFESLFQPQELDNPRISDIRRRGIADYNIDFMDKNRTLLYGRDTRIHNFHLYVHNGAFHISVADLLDGGCLGLAENTRILNDDTRISEILPYTKKGSQDAGVLYPQACDYDFCRVMKSMKIKLPFAYFKTDSSSYDPYIVGIAQDIQKENQGELFQE